MDSTITAERNKMSEAEIARLYQEANQKALIKRRVERTALVAVNVVAAFVIFLPRNLICFRRVLPWIILRRP